MEEPTNKCLSSLDPADDGGFSFLVLEHCHLGDLQGIFSMGCFMYNEPLVR
jgi:hypothetical protein